MQEELSTLGRTPNASDERRLAAVVHADIVGYSRLIGLDDKGTVHRLGILRDELIEPELRRHNARIVNTAGDSLMLVFPSITAAVRWAVDFQRRVPEYDGELPAEKLIRFRIGINIADIIRDHADIHGSGINVAARLQAVCPPGGICVSRAVYDHLRGRLSLPFEPLGELHLKNIAAPVEGFVLRLDPATSGRGRGGAWVRPVGRTLFFGVLALLAIAVALAGWRAWYKTESVGALSVIAGSAAPQPLSIAVLPLANLSGDPDQAYLADGIAEDLTTDLSHLAGAQVIARESAFTYRGRAVDVREVGRQLGVRFVLEGSVRKLGDVVRVNAQLVETELGTHVWAERFDEPIRDLSAGQDDIVARIGSALNVQLVNVDLPARTSRRGQNPAAFDLVLRARSVLNQPPTWQRWMIAAGLFEQALQLDPDSVPAMAGVASILVRGFHGKNFMKRAADLIAAAEQVEPGSPEVLAAKFLMQRRLAMWDESLATFRALLAVDSSAAGLAAAETRICSSCWGPPESAIPLLEQAIRLNPRSPNLGVLQVNLGRLLLREGRDTEAITWLERALQSSSVTEDATAADLPMVSTKRTAQFLLASAYALTNRTEDARRMLALGLQSPDEMDTTVRSWLHGASRYHESPAGAQQERRIIEGLRRAGLRDHLDETADSGVPPQSTLREVGGLDSPTPMTVPGAITIRTEQLQALLDQSKPLLLTTADSRFNPTIPGTIRIELPEGSSLVDEWQPVLRRMVDGLLGEQSSRPIVVFGGSMNHWESYNLALRLAVLGYRNIYWYRGGWEAWDAHDLPKGPLTLEAR